MQPSTFTLALALFAGTALATRDKSKALRHGIPGQPPHPQITVPVDSIALPIQSVTVPVENIIVPSVQNIPLNMPIPPAAPVIPGV